MNDPFVPIVFLVIVIIAQATGSFIFFRKTNIIPNLDIPAHIPLPGGKGFITTSRKIITTSTALIAFGAVVALIAVAVASS